MRRNKTGQFINVELIPKVCKVCGKTTLMYPSDAKRGRGNFCSPKCVGQAFTLGVIKREFKYPRTTSICAYCGKTFEHFVAKKRKYCSYNCASAHKWELVNPKVLRVNNDRRVYHKNAVRIARMIFTIWECFICHSKTDVTVHHIDKDTKNNHPNNLQLLCKSCHSRHHARKSFSRGV
jgi:5-methylcytosine-specific restriction endonuclease McrA